MVLFGLHAHAFTAAEDATIEVLDDVFAHAAALDITFVRKSAGVTGSWGLLAGTSPELPFSGDPDAASVSLKDCLHPIKRCLHPRSEFSGACGDDLLGMGRILVGEVT